MMSGQLSAYLRRLKRSQLVTADQLRPIVRELRAAVGVDSHTPATNPPTSHSPGHDSSSHRSSGHRSADRRLPLPQPRQARPNPPPTRTKGKKSRQTSLSQPSPTHQNLPEPPQQSDIEALGNVLVTRGLLTRWQHEQLKGGQEEGFLLGSYRLLDLLGSGGTSKVYLAEHSKLRRLVAIKVLPAEQVGNSSLLDRLYLEAQAIASLDHPNIVRAFDSGQHRNFHYLVMEYVPGWDLERLVAKRGPLEPFVAVDYIRQAAEGLEHAHCRGLVHRDIKPANLLLTPEGTVKILDFGLARVVTHSQSLTLLYEDNLLGTADYLAPEQALNSRSADARSDIYSLGCTLYYLLAGHPPYPHGSLAERLLQHQNAPAPPLRQDRASVPEELEAMCLRMMAKRPKDRYQGAAQIAETLTEWLTDQQRSGSTTVIPALAHKGSQPNGSPALSKQAPAALASSGEGWDSEFETTPTRVGTSLSNGSVPSETPSHPQTFAQTPQAEPSQSEQASHSPAFASQPNISSAQTTSQKWETNRGWEEEPTPIVARAWITGDTTVSDRELTPPEHHTPIQQSPPPPAQNFQAPSYQAPSYQAPSYQAQASQGHSLGCPTPGHSPAGLPTPPPVPHPAQLPPGVSGKPGNPFSPGDPLPPGAPPLPVALPLPKSPPLPPPEAPLPVGMPLVSPPQAYGPGVQQSPPHRVEDESPSSMISVADLNRLASLGRSGRCGDARGWDDVEISRSLVLQQRQSRRNWLLILGALLAVALFCFSLRMLLGN